MNAVEWYIKINSSYVKMIEPSEFDIETEDLDNKTFRSVLTGNMIPTIISRDWSKLAFKYDKLTRQEVYSLSVQLKKYPIYVKVKHPFYTGTLEAQFRCSRKKLSKLKTKSELYTMSFNLVQTKKVSGQ